MAGKLLTGKYGGLRPKPPLFPAIIVPSKVSTIYSGLRENGFIVLSSSSRPVPIIYCRKTAWPIFIIFSGFVIMRSTIAVKIFVTNRAF